MAEDRAAILGFIVSRYRGTLPAAIGVCYRADILVDIVD
jgi:hypothetical protein